MRAAMLRPWGGPSRRASRSGRTVAPDRFVFSRPVRRALSVYLAVAVVVCAVLAPRSMSPQVYLETMVLVTCAAWAPGIVIAWRAARRAAPEDRLVWWLWAVGFLVGCVSTVRLAVLDDELWNSARERSITSAVISVTALTVTNTLIMRTRSGQRTVLIDIADIVMAMVAIMAPLALVAAEPVLDAPAGWFTVSASVWFLGALYGLAVALVLYLRVDPADRSVARYGIAFGLIALAATSAQVVLGIHDFTLVPGPFLAAHALCAGFAVVFLVHSTRRASAGLERFPARAQVRRRPAVTILVLVSIPLTGALVWFERHDDLSLAIALVAAGLLVVLFCVRSLLAARETRLLYREVERSADERAELLTDVLAHAEADRHRVATHLHRQSVQLYAALSSVVDPIGAGDDRSRASARVAEHLRADLGRQSDDLARFARAVRPPCEDPPSRLLFATPLRVQLDGLFPEGARPRLEADLDPELVLDWTDEAVLVRLAELAFTMLRERVPAPELARVRLGLDEADLVLDVALRRPPRPGGIADEVAVGAFRPDELTEDERALIDRGAEVLGGSVESIRAPGELGVRVRVPLAPSPRRPDGPEPPPRPDLRVVR